MMRDKLGVMLVESLDGDVAVQLFADPDKAAESFEELKGRVGEPRKRVTFLNCSYKETDAGLVLTIADFRAKDLPVPPEEPPDGYVIGEGPRKEMKA